VICVSILSLKAYDMDFFGIESDSYESASDLMYISVAVDRSKKQAIDHDSSWFSNTDVSSSKSTMSFSAELNTSINEDFLFHLSPSSNLTKFQFDLRLDKSSANNIIASCTATLSLENEYRGTLQFQQQSSGGPPIAELDVYIRYVCNFAISHSCIQHIIFICVHVDGKVVAAMEHSLHIV
jgi:hypothetical protein